MGKIDRKIEKYTEVDTTVAKFNNIATTRQLHTDLINTLPKQSKPLSIRITPYTHLHEFDTLGTFCGIARASNFRILASNLDVLLTEHINSLTINDRKQMCHVSLLMSVTRFISIELSISFRESIISTLATYSDKAQLINFIQNSKEITLIAIMEDAKRYAFTNKMKDLRSYSKEF